MGDSGSNNFDNVVGINHQVGKVSDERRWMNYYGFVTLHPISKDKTDDYSIVYTCIYYVLSYMLEPNDIERLHFNIKQTLKLVKGDKHLLNKPFEETRANWHNEVFLAAFDDFWDLEGDYKLKVPFWMMILNRKISWLMWIPNWYLIRMFKKGDRFNRIFAFFIIIMYQLPKAAHETAKLQANRPVREDLVEYFGEDHPIPDYFERYATFLAKVIYGK